MVGSLKKYLVLKFGFVFMAIHCVEIREVDLFVKALRGVSGVNLIYYQVYADQVIVKVLGNTNRVERALRELTPRFRLQIDRKNIKC